jgi:hypothetical protein
MRGKYLSELGEYAESILAHMENTVNKVFCSTQNRLSVHEKYVNVSGEYAEIIYAYMRRRKETLGVFSLYAKRHKTEHIVSNDPR